MVYTLYILVIVSRLHFYTSVRYHSPTQTAPSQYADRPISTPLVLPLSSITRLNQFNNLNYYLFIFKNKRTLHSTILMSCMTPYTSQLRTLHSAHWHTAVKDHIVSISLITKFMLVPTLSGPTRVKEQARNLGGFNSFRG